MSSHFDSAPSGPPDEKPPAKAGFDSTDQFLRVPFQDIERVGQISLLRRNIFCVSWLLGRFCNYKCSYCWPYARSSVPDHRPLSLLIRTMDEIKRQARERGFHSFHFSFSGGEPSLHKGLLDLLRHYAEGGGKYQSVHMTSNLSRSLSWLEKFAKAASSLDRTSVTASYHREFAAREGFADKIKHLQERKVHVTINIVMLPALFEVLWEDALYFHSRGINVTLKPQSDSKAQKLVEGYSAGMLSRLRGGLPQRDYECAVQTAETAPPPDREGLAEKPPLPRSTVQVELTDGRGESCFIDQAERLNSLGFNRFQGWECSSGFRSLIIREPDGLIKRSYSCCDKPLGHIETGFRLFSKPEPCRTPSCVSSADSKIPKRRPGSRLPLWPEEAEAPPPAGKSSPAGGGA